MLEDLGQIVEQSALTITVENGLQSPKPAFHMCTTRKRIIKNELNEYTLDG